MNLVPDGISETKVRALMEYSRSRFGWHLMHLSHLENDARSTLLSYLGCKEINPQKLKDKFELHKEKDKLNQQLAADTANYLPHQLLNMIDRTTMGPSIEGRVPFLDHRVVEKAFSIPGDRKIAGKRGKNLLFELGRDSLPDEVLYRKKAGFPNLMQLQFSGELNDLLRRIQLTPDSFSRRYLPEIWSDLATGHDPARPRAWLNAYTLFNLELWHKVHVVDERIVAPEENIYDLFRLPEH